MVLACDASPPGRWMQPGAPRPPPTARPGFESATGVTQRPGPALLPGDNSTLPGGTVPDNTQIIA
eukprot:767009-Hanusia_phi.AAC.1